MAFYKLDILALYVQYFSKYLYTMFFFLRNFITHKIGYDVGEHQKDVLGTRVENILYIF